MTQPCHISRNCIASNQVFSFLSNYFNFPSNLFINSFRKVAPAFPCGDRILTFCNFSFWNGIKNLLKMPFAWIGTEVELRECAKLEILKVLNIIASDYELQRTTENLWVEYLTSKLRLYVEWWRLWKKELYIWRKSLCRALRPKFTKSLSCRIKLLTKNCKSWIWFIYIIYNIVHKLHLRRGKTCCYK